MRAAIAAMAASVGGALFLTAIRVGLALPTTPTMIAGSSANGRLRLAARIGGLATTRARLLLNCAA